MTLKKATIEQIEEFNYKLYLYHREVRDIEFEAPRVREKDTERENFCAYFDGRVIGFISYEKVTKDYIEIKRIFVEKEYRRRRFATMMLNSIFNMYKYADVTAKTYTLEGMKLFASYGFEITSMNRNGSMILEGVIE